jgi:hypothetical protein
MNNLQLGTLTLSASSASGTVVLFLFVIGGDVGGDELFKDAFWVGMAVGDGLVGVLEVTAAVFASAVEAGMVEIAGPWLRVMTATADFPTGAAVDSLDARWAVTRVIGAEVDILEVFLLRCA